MRIGEKEIGYGHPLYIIAETGVTHNGSILRALSLVDAAAYAGADAIKFQALDPDALHGEEGKKLEYIYLVPSGAGMRSMTGNLYDLLVASRLPDDAWPMIADRARRRGIHFFSTVESLWGVQLMEHLGVPAYKICAWDVTAEALIYGVARTQKPILIDVDPVHGDIKLLKHTYPFYMPGAARTILMYAPHHEPGMSEFLLVDAEHATVGYSAPSWDISFDRAAISAGAAVIERRLTLNDRDLQGHHHIESLDPDGFKSWVGRMREQDKIFGGGRHPYRRDPATGQRPAR